MDYTDRLLSFGIRCVHIGYVKALRVGEAEKFTDMTHMT